MNQQHNLRGTNRSAESRRGFSLIEAVMSLAILAILMATIGAATTVMMRLMPRASDPRTIALSIGSTVELFESDTQAAIAVRLAEPETMSILVNGLGAAGAPEIVTYRFDPGTNELLRAVGAESLQPISANLSNARFEYRITQRDHAELKEIESAESAFGTDAITCNDTAFSIEPGTAIRQRLAPTFEDGTVSWKIESINLRLKQHTIFSSGTCRVSFHRMSDSGTMNHTAIAQVDISIASLPLSILPATMRTYQVEGMPWLNTDEKLAVVMRTTGGSIRSHIATRAGHPPMEFYQFSDGSATELPGVLLCFRINGAAMQPGDEPVTIELIEAVTIEIVHTEIAEPVVRYARPPVPIGILP